MNEDGVFVKSACTNCGGSIEFPEHGLGETIDCPHCGEKIELALPKSNRRPAYLIFVWMAFIALAGFSGHAAMIQIGCGTVSLMICVLWFIVSLTHNRRTSWSRILGGIAFGCGSMMPLVAADIVLLGKANHGSTGQVAVPFIICIVIALGFIAGAIHLVFERRK